MASAPGPTRRRRLLVRADAGATLGTGHVLRCLAVAEAWRARGGEARFLVPPGLGDLARRIEREGHTMETFGALPGSAEDARQVLDEAARWGADWLLVDVRSADVGYLAAVGAGPARLAVLDDLGHAGPLHADVVVNPNWGATAALYPRLSPATRLLAGGDAILLRADVCAAALKPARTRQGPRRLLLTFGGSDPHGLAQRLLDGAAQAPAEGWTLEVVLGPLAPDLRGNAPRAARVERSPQDFASRLADSDAVVVCAGGTMFEALHLGRPLASFHANATQARIVGDLASEGVVADLGDAAQADWGKLLRLLLDGRRMAALAANAARDGPRLVDGLGVERVLSELDAPDVRLAPLAEAHLQDLAHILAEPAVQQGFLIQAPSLRGQREWFAKRRDDPTSLHRVILVDGVVRGACGLKGIDRRAGTAETFVYLGADARARGVATRAVLAQLGEARSLGLRRVHLWVDEANAAAIRLYRRVGFEAVPEIRLHPWDGREVRLQRMEHPLH